MLHNPKEKVWVERFRPQRIEDCILPASIKKQFAKIVESGQVPNMLLHGGAGVGKTTVARAMCQEIGSDYIVINCSEETGIDTLRTTIRDFASTVSFSDKGKVVILDEFDYASPNLQAGLRNAMESFSKNCSFIMTCNYPNRIMDAIFSRSVAIGFDIAASEKPQLQMEFFKRIVAILEFEKVGYDKKAVATLVNKFFPDNRRTLNQLQQFARAGDIDEGVLIDLQEVSIEKLVEAIKTKSFKDVRQWCVENAQNDLKGVYTKLYKSLKNFVSNDSIPEVILILDDYQRHDSVVPDRELHMAAMCVQIMMTATFK